jgi:hypothetical protein
VSGRSKKVVTTVNSKTALFADILAVSGKKYRYSKLETFRELSSPEAWHVCPCFLRISMV